MVHFNRRDLLAGASACLVGAALIHPAKAQSVGVARLYGSQDGEPFPVQAIDLRRIRPQYLRARVSYDGNEQAGTIVIDPATRYLFLVEGDGRALRYGVGVGRQGFAWDGTAVIQAKREWPDWYPPKEMLARDPHLLAGMSQLQSGLGMPGGSRNPLGARAMYLFQGSRDTLYRIHGTVEPWSIGTQASSGCIRMINQDVIDLFGRVTVGTKVVVLAAGDAVQARQELDVVGAGSSETQAYVARQHPAEPTDPSAFDRMEQDTYQ